MCTVRDLSVIRRESGFVRGFVCKVALTILLCELPKYLKLYAPGDGALNVNDPVGSQAKHVNLQTEEKPYQGRI